MSSSQLYLLHTSSAHLSFRVPELHSIAQVYGFKVDIVSTDLTRAFLTVRLEEEDHARKLAERCIFIKSVYLLVAQGQSYDELITTMQSTSPRTWEADQDKTYYFELRSVGHKVPSQRKKETMLLFEFMDFRGKATMKGADVTWRLLEDYDVLLQEPGRESREVERDGQFRAVYIGRLVSEGTARSLIDKFEVKQRAFYGNTSMESEMALLMANQALAAPGKLVYDPFAGTGSTLYTSAYWGATVLGSDIDGRQMRGKDRSNPGIFRAGNQYGIRSQILDCITFDVTRNPWRRGGLFDAIVTDPPYGVRAGAKRQGRKEGRKKLIDKPVWLEDRQCWSHERPDYIPAFKPYEMTDLVYDLILFSRWMLVKGGRLVFFLPTVTEEWDSLDIPVVEGMREIKYGEGSSQDFNKWSRRLITIEKTTDEEYSRPDFMPVDNTEQEKEAGHHQFREKYYLLGQNGSGASTPAGGDAAAA